MFDSIFLVISREEVEATNTSKALVTLNSLLENPEKARMLCEAVDISFAGYERDSRELFEIEEVRKFVFELDDKFPFWLYFLTKFGTGLQCLYLCKMPPFLTTKAKAEIFPERLVQLLERRWLPAMNHICKFTGMRDEEVESLTERSLSYLTEGPFRLPAQTLFREAGDEERYRLLVPAFLKVIDGIPETSRDELVDTFNLKIALRYSDEQVSELEPYVERFFDEYFPQIEQTRQIQRESEVINNKWRQGHTHFALPEIPDSFMNSAGIYYLHATLDTMVGEEIVLIIYDPTDFIMELAELTPFNFQTGSVAVNTSYGPMFAFLFWVTHPLDERRIFAGFDKPVDISNPASIEPWMQLQRQTHLHLLLVDANYEVQGFYEFENFSSFDEGVKIISQLDPSTIVSQDNARREYFSNYGIAELIEISRTGR